MMHCKETARLVSEMKDHRISLRQRIGVYVHIVMCRMCRAYNAQLSAITRLSRRAGSTAMARGTATMPPEAKARLRACMKDRLSRPQ